MIGMQRQVQQAEADDRADLDADDQQQHVGKRLLARLMPDDALRHDRAGTAAARRDQKQAKLADPVTTLLGAQLVVAKQEICGRVRQDEVTNENHKALPQNRDGLFYGIVNDIATIKAI